MKGMSFMFRAATPWSAALCRRFVTGQLTNTCKPTLQRSQSADKAAHSKEGRRLDECSLTIIMRAFIKSVPTTVLRKIVGRTYASALDLGRRFELRLATAREEP